MALYKIPLSGTNQKINVLLGKTTYKLQLIYRGDKWFLDVMDVSGNYLICALPMVLGDNLLAQHQHIISGGLYVSNKDPEEKQIFSSLGTEMQLYWSDD